MQTDFHFFPNSRMFHFAVADASQNVPHVISGSHPRWANCGSDFASGLRKRFFISPPIPTKFHQ